MAANTVIFDKQQTIPAIQSGIVRYNQTKRKLSRPNRVGNMAKINRTNKSNEQARSSNDNRFSILAKVENNQAELWQETQKTIFI